MDQYKVVGRIGEGAHGLVLRGQRLGTGQEIALKRVLLKKLEDGIPTTVIREIKALQEVDCEYVVQLLDVFPQGLGFVLVFEFMPSGLWEMLRDAENPLTVPQMKAYMIMLLKGVAYLHEHSIMHRDLKPANLLISRDGVLKIADLGLGRMFWAEQNRPYSHQVATRWYRAPELLYGARYYTEAVDLWAVGCILGELLTCSPLFPGETDIEQLAIVLRTLGTPTAETWPGMTELPDFNKITFPETRGVSWDQIFPDCVPEAVDLVKKFLVYNGDRRLKAKQEPFDPEEFVERLAWRTVADSRGEGTGHFDPVLLHETFLQAIKDLQILQERQQKKCERLEMMCREEENGHWQHISQLQDRNKASVNMFQELDERINYVATKVIHLGDQLESVNTPRSRAVEAQKLMNHFAEFLSPGPLLAEVFTDKTRVDEAADVIQKLHLIAQELPSGKFEKAKKKISTKYDEIERSLIEEFVKAHRSDDKGRMKEIATILSHFKGYPQCIDAFIEQSQMGAFTGKDIFRDVIPLCEKNFSVMTEVFSNPDQVMAKFVLNIYHLKLQKYIVTNLSDRSDTDRYLKNLYDLYSRTVKLSNDLSHFQMGNDNMYLSKLTMNIFQKYLDSYISVETKCLKEKSAAILHKYYEAKNHQKKQIQTGGFQDLRRDLQAVIGTRANFNIAQIENYGGETFLSEEVAIALLQESKLAFRRCELLSRQSDMPGNALQIFEILLHYLMAEHLDYALELGLQSVPIPENKTQPQISFFDVLRQCNAIVHLLEKQFIDSLVPLVISTPKHGDCLQKKKYLLEQIEFKLDIGLDRSINAIVGWVKIYLQTEQKKTDFKPETDVDTLASPACLAVVQYVGSMVERIRDSVDGKNVEALMTEFGARFHRVIYEHLQQFQYNSAGAMCAICDVNEYRKCVKEFKVPLVNTLFDTLHALCNLLLVKPENLKQVCTGDQLAGLDRSILLNFIQLRSDYKTQKLAVSLKGLAT